MITQMGTLNNGRNRSAVFDGLYGVQLWRPLPQSAQVSEDETPRTTAEGVESSTCQLQKGGRTQQRLLIRWAKYLQQWTQNIHGSCLFFYEREQLAHVFFFFFCNCRRLWQHRPSCLKPIHCSITCTAASISTKSWHLSANPIIWQHRSTPSAPK